MPRVDTAWPLLRDRHRQANIEALAGILGDVADDVAARHDAGARVLLARRWYDALAAVMLGRNTDTATEVAARVAAALGGDYDPAVMDAWLARNAEIGSSNILGALAVRLDDAEEDAAIDTVLTQLTTSSTSMYAASMVTAIAGFASRDAGQKLGAELKVWQVNSANPRSLHKRMNGEAAAIGGKFSNRMDCPGDPDGGADEVAECECSLTIVRA